MTRIPHPRIILTDADGLADNTEPAFLVLEITRAEIEAGNVASALERLHVLTDSRENVLRYRESMAFTVGGYDSDPRELYEVHEVRAYFRRLATEWPHWLWYLVRGHGSIALLLALLCQVRAQQNKDGSVGVEFQGVGELRATLLDLFHRGNWLFAAHEIPERLVTASAATASAELFG